jgi:hypothetical protein
LGWVVCLFSFWVVCWVVCSPSSLTHLRPVRGL